MEEIIIKQCSNIPLSQKEKRRLDAWLNESEENTKLYEQLKLSLLYPTDQKRRYLEEHTWKNIELRIQADERLQQNQIRSHNFRWAAAAILLFVIAGGVYLLNYKMKEPSALKRVAMIEKVTQAGQKLTVELSDGSVIKLNAGSRLIAPEKFTGHNRKVTISGEAFFDIAHDKNHPFIISANGLEVEVLGTSFNVRSYPEEGHTAVAVATGKVSVTSRDAGHEYLIPGEKIEYESGSGMMNKSSFDWEREFGWKENILLFHGAALKTVLDRLSRWYGVKFNISDKDLSSSKKFSGRYQEASLEEIMKGLAYVYKFNFTIENKTITITM